MKAQILKIAGVKTEAEFYKKYPTEEAFMKKHGHKLKKAVGGIELDKLGVTGSPFQGMPKKFTQFSVPETLQFDTNVSENPYLAGSIIGGKKNDDYTKVGSSSTTGGTTKSKEKKSFDFTRTNSAIETLANNADDVISGIQGLREDQKQIKNLRKYGDISSVMAAAAESQPEPIKQKYVRPEDALLTNPMARGKRGAGVFKKGGKVKGNATEIQNTYTPGDIYTDQEYLPVAQTGINLDPLAGMAGGIGGMLGSAAGKGSGKGGSASQIGSAIGGIAGSFIPLPGVGTALGSLAGGFIGGLFDGDIQNKKQQALDKIQANVDRATLSNGARSLQMQNKGFMENGGYMNPEYNPQVIAKFGDYDVDQLLAPPHDADMLRAGGHLKEYTPPSARAMYTGRDLPYQMEHGGQLAMGGDLEVHRGEAETMSYNPYLPDGGETIMFRGPSHDNGGMPISFGENGVEVEGGEPAIKLQDGGSPDGNLVVYGNMVIPEYGAAEIGDEKAKGKKFKHYIADLSKVEAKQNKLIDKSTLMLDGVDENDPFDQLKLNTGQANLIGADMKLKSIADKKKNTAAVQNAILDTASEMGLESDALAKGKIKYAKANDPYAEFGAKLEQFKPGGKKSKKAKVAAPLSPLQEFVKGTPFYERKRMAMDRGITNFVGSAEQNQKLLDMINERRALNQQNATPLPTEKFPKLINIPTVQAMMNKSIATGDYKTGLEPSLEGDDSSGLNWWDLGNTALSNIAPFVRPTNQLPLDPAQLSGEMYALANNQVEPVYAQTYQPLLSQTTNISLQDQLNEITSQARSAERLAQNNPAALAMLASQAAEAKNKVLGEQFRLNQGEQNRVIEANRQAINEANRFNLGIYDQQQQRQAQARSNTKAQAMAALNSISDKIAKNKLENRELSISENLYNFRFTPKGVAYNINPPAGFAPYGSGSGTGYGAGQMPSGMIPDYDTDEDTGKPKLVGYKLPKQTKTKSRNGSIVQAIKNL